MPESVLKADQGEMAVFEKHQKGIFMFLGGCPRIAIFSQIKAFLKNKHSHIVDITSIIFSK